MPRKAAVDPSAEPVEPRRSSRISSQSKPAPAPVPEKKPRKAGKKRTADESQHDDGETEPANGEKAAASDSTPQDDQSNKKVNSFRVVNFIIHSYVDVRLKMKQLKRTKRKTNLRLIFQSSLDHWKLAIYFRLSH
jgi:hypothetical protein